ncbi:hypothetical protein XELAEV_180263632mg, partial [Xenopus laevis]
MRSLIITLFIFTGFLR